MWILNLVQPMLRLECNFYILGLYMCLAWQYSMKLTAVAKRTGLDINVNYGMWKWQTCTSPEWKSQCTVLVSVLSPHTHNQSWHQWKVPCHMWWTALVLSGGHCRKCEWMCVQTWDLNPALSGEHVFLLLTKHINKLHGLFAVRLHCVYSDVICLW